MEWRLSRPEGNDSRVRFMLRGSNEKQQMYVLGLIMRELGNRAFLQPAEGYREYYNYRITLTSGTDFSWLHSTMWGLLQHRLGIAVILY